MVWRSMQGLPDAWSRCGAAPMPFGLIPPFLEDARVCHVTCRSGAGLGLEPVSHAGTIGRRRPVCLHGNRTYLMEDDAGQIIEPLGVSGWDYPGVVSRT